MSWWPDFTNVKASVFTEAIKKKACGFLLRRYGGNWLKEKAINLDQLTLDLYNGRAKFTNFELDVANINELLDGYSLPLEVVDCYVGSLDIFVPWASIFADNSHLEIQNLEVTFRHRARDTKESSLFDSMLYSSMTTSMKLAEECLKNENSEEKKPSSTSMPYYEGLHDLACTVEAIFVKVKGTLIDTVVCFEHINENYTTVFELRIARVEYFDDEVERSGVVTKEDEMYRGGPDGKEDRKVCDLASVRSKNLIFHGVRLYMGIDREDGQLNKYAVARSTKLNSVDSLLIGDFMGRHKLKVSFSQEQEANSVKMLIEPQVEGINFVLCPQVLSYIHRICSDISNSIAKDEPAEKIITSEDYEKIRKGIEAPSIPTVGGGGKQSFTPSGRNDLFQSMAPSSFSNSGFQSMESSLSSIASSCSTLNGGKKRGKNSSRREKKPEEDRISSTEISLRISFISVILLHEDAPQVGESWHDNLRSLDEKYLKVIRNVSLAGIANSSDLIKLRKRFSAILGRDHFSLMLKQMDMTALLDSKDVCLRDKFFDLDLTVGLADLAEGIVQSGGKGIEFCPWLMFEEGFLVVRDKELPSIGRSSFKLKIEPLEREEKSLMSRSSSSPFLVTLTTSKCSSELDITVINRIHAIAAAFSSVTSKQSLHQTRDPTQSFLFSNEVDDERREKIAIALSSSSWTCKIRFPRADLTEASRLRKGGRHLHDDSLLFEIQKLNLKTELLLMENGFQEFELYFMSAKGHLMLNSDAHCLLHVSSNLFMKGQDDGFDWPRIKMRLSSGQNSVLGNGMNFPIKELDPMSASFYPMMAQGNRAPFSSKRRQFKNRELVEPGERSEMTSFLDIEGNNSNIFIDANLQQVLLFLPNKKVLEILYNRLLGDMLLWTPLIPANLPYEATAAPSLFVEQNLFRSEMRSPSDENVHDQDDNDDFMKMEMPEKQSKACVSIYIQEGRIVADMQDFPQPRRFVLSLTDLALPFVSCYHGDPLLHYFCMQACTLDLSHTGISEGLKGSSGYDIHSRTDGKNWQKILQMNKDNLGLDRLGSMKDALSMTLMIKEESNQLVHYKLALKLRNCSLLHVDMPKEEQHWIFQLMELFSLVDYDIPGYQLPQSISELHFSLENCGVEYRPSSLPHHIVLFSESVQITSNAIPDAVGYKLNIWIEDTGLFISSKQIVKKIDLKKDFVCVADINSFDLSLKQLKEFNEIRPQTSLAASINRLNIRTCSDSFVALSQVIIHLANMGEFMQQPNTGTNTSEEPLDAPVATMEVRQMEVNKLLEDAINSEFTSRTDSPEHQVHPNRVIVSKFDEKPVAYVFNSPLVSSQESLSSSYSDGSDNVKSSEDPIVTRTQRLPQDGAVAEKLNYIDNHFARPTAKSETFESENYPVPVEKYQLIDTSVTWLIYGGCDFSSDLTDRKVVIHKQRKKKWQEICGSGRNHLFLIELHLNKVQLLHEVYPEGKRDLSRDVLFIREVEVLDKLEISDINKFLHLYVSETLPKPINGNMVKVSTHYVRPEESVDRKECVLRISLQPVKLNIDQDSLTFLTNFFTEVNNMARKTFLPQSSKMPPEGTSDLEEEGSIEMSPKKEKGASYAPIFFSSIRFSPDVVIKIDYKGKRVEQGTLVGLLVGLTQLNQSQIVLKKISYKRGLLGVDKVADYVFNEWVRDIRTNQLSGLLRGVGPMNSFFQFVQGVRDLFWMPVEQYRKDGRIMRGIQRGTYSFASCTAISALELTNKLFNTILFIAEAAHDIVSPSTSSTQDRKRGAHKRQRQLKQPEDLREGVTRACAVVKEGLHNRATELMDVVAKEHEQKGVAGAIGGVLRQIPPTVIEPIIVASKATTNVLGGVRNQLMPDMRKEDMEKWKNK